MSAFLLQSMVVDSLEIFVANLVLTANLFAWALLRGTLGTATALFRRDLRRDFSHKDSSGGSLTRMASSR